MPDLNQQFNKTKIILCFLSTVVLGASFLINYDLKSNRSMIKDKMGIFAQRLPLYFMSGFGQRIMYLSSELALAAQELDFFGQELKGLAEKCDCRNTQSVCRPSGVRIDIVKVAEDIIRRPIEKKIDEWRGKLDQEIDALKEKYITKPHEKLNEEIGNKIKGYENDINKKFEEWSGSLEKDKAQINEEINEINKELDEVEKEINDEIKKREEGFKEDIKDINLWLDELQDELPNIAEEIIK
jgi:hypothetical protein